MRDGYWQEGRSRTGREKHAGRGGKEIRSEGEGGRGERKELYKDFPLLLQALQCEQEEGHSIAHLQS